ncbi:MAG: YjhX family toxin [Oricola sp.]
MERSSIVCGQPAAIPDPNIMDISRAEQRILHLLAQGGHIEIIRQNRMIERLDCITRDGWRYPGLDLGLFRKLKRRRTIASKGGGPYRITRRGLELVRSQFDNR